MDIFMVNLPGILGSRRFRVGGGVDEWSNGKGLHGFVILGF